ncbi:MAG: hypothetical protein HY698_11985 [Deltaproteobacteria bacterium]|nr:hypothetical protein [Deltaproteobacteria bacterium]
MPTLRLSLLLTTIIFPGSLASAAADAQRRTAEPQGVKLVATVHPDQGFVDDAFALDQSGARLALVRTDGSSVTEIEVVDLANGGATTSRVNLAPLTHAVGKVDFVLGGSKLLVTTRRPDEEGAKISALLVGMDGKLLRTMGPAHDVLYTQIAGKDAVALYDKRPGPKGGTVHEISYFRLEDGKRIGKKQVLSANAEGRVARLDMKVLYFKDAYSKLVGRKRGGYDKSKDRQMSDREAVVDLVSGAVAEATPPGDLIAYMKLVKLRQEHPLRNDFVVVTEDQRGLELISSGDERKLLGLAEPFDRYDAKSLVQEASGDGRIFFSLTVDPVNADAVSRKKADPELIDLHALDLASGTVQRLARLPKLGRSFAWHVRGRYWAVLRKHKGFDRGGADLEIYEVAVR